MADGFVFAFCSPSKLGMIRQVLFTQKMLKASLRCNAGTAKFLGLINSLKILQ